MIKNFEILNNSVNHSILNNNNNNIDNSIIFSNDYLSEHNFSSNYLKYSDYYILVNKFYDTSKWLNVSLITLITLRISFSPILVNSYLKASSKITKS